MIRSFVLLSFMMSATVAVANTSSDSGTAPAAKPVKEKKICRMDDADSTSRMRKRICRTVKVSDEVGESKNDVQGTDAR